MSKHDVEHEKVRKQSPFVACLILFLMLATVFWDGLNFENLLVFALAAAVLLYLVRNPIPHSSNTLGIVLAGCILQALSIFDVWGITQTAGLGFVIGAVVLVLLREDKARSFGKKLSEEESRNNNSSV